MNEDKPVVDYLNRLKTAIRALLEMRGGQMVYQRELEEQMRREISPGDPVTEVLVKSLLNPSPEERREIENILKSCPRGSWVIIENAVPDRGMHWFDAFVSTGTGTIDGSHGSYEKRPSFDEVYGHMFGYEVYLMRQKAEKEIRQARDVCALEKYGYSPGMSFKNIDLQNGDGVYSTASITEIGSDGEVTLFLTKRGTRKRWTIQIGADRLKECVPQKLGEAGTLFKCDSGAAFSALHTQKSFLSARIDAIIYIH